MKNKKRANKRQFKLNRKRYFSKPVVPLAIKQAYQAFLMDKLLVDVMRPAIFDNRSGKFVEYVVIPEGFVNQTEENNNDTVLIEGHIFPELFQ